MKVIRKKICTIIKIKEIKLEDIKEFGKGEIYFIVSIKDLKSSKIKLAKSFNYEHWKKFKENKKYGLLEVKKPKDRTKEWIYLNHTLGIWCLEEGKGYEIKIRVMEADEEAMLKLLKIIKFIQRLLKGEPLSQSQESDFNEIIEKEEIDILSKVNSLFPSFAKRAKTIFSSLIADANKDINFGDFKLNIRGGVMLILKGISYLAKRNKDDKIGTAIEEYTAGEDYKPYLAHIGLEGGAADSYVELEIIPHK